MSEVTPPTNEMEPTPNEVVLSYAKFTLDSDITPLIGKEKALEQHGINGDIVVVLQLPVEKDGGSPKKIAIVDYGVFNEGEEPSLFYIEGKPSNFFGKAKGRYGLFAFNYVPVDHMLAYVPLDEGKSTFGSAGGYPDNHTLGLSQPYAGNQAISREHFSISLNSDNSLAIEDHSTNGTGIKFSEILHSSKQHERGHKVKRIAKILGRKSTTQS